MIASASRVIPLAIALTSLAACVDQDQPSLRYTGTMHVTQRTYSTNGTVTGGIFGLITIPEELTPTATVDGCDYWGAHRNAGITLGDLTVRGIGPDVVVQPASFIDGMLYVGQYADTNAYAPGATVHAELADTYSTVAVEAPAPELLANVSLPTTLSLSHDATVTWQAGSADEVEVHVEATGLGTEQTLFCATADTGSFTIPAAALAQLGAHHADSANVFVTRRNLGETASEKSDVELTLAAETEVFQAATLQP